MSRRRRRAGAESGAERAGEAPVAPGRQNHSPGRAPYRVRPLFQVVILVAIFAVVTLVAEVAGAANLGVSLGIAQIVFGIALVAVMLRS